MSCVDDHGGGAHSMLIVNSSILQAREYHGVAVYPLRCLEQSVFSLLEYILIWLYRENPSIKIFFFFVTAHILLIMTLVGVETHSLGKLRSNI